MVKVSDRSRLALAVGVSLAGLVFATVGVAWVAGSLGISASAANQIVSAIMAGGIALAIIMSIFGGGIISAIAWTVRWYVVKKGRVIAAL